MSSKLWELSSSVNGVATAVIVSNIAPCRQRMWPLTGTAYAESELQNQKDPKDDRLLPTAYKLASLKRTGQEPRKEVYLWAPHCDDFYPPQMTKVGGSGWKRRLGMTLLAWCSWIR
jgi:hypothetical protein